MAKIVVVEDDVLLAKMYAKLLSFENHEVVIATDGEEALPTIKKIVPDLILMDIMMPKMNGLQALDQIKADPATAKTPVVVMSNLVSVNSSEDVLAKGAARYVDKSQYDPKKIAELVNEVLANPAGQSPGPAATNQAQGGQAGIAQPQTVQTSELQTEPATPQPVQTANPENKA